MTRSAKISLSKQCWNAAMSAMAMSARWEEALALMNDMERKGVSPDQHSYSAASELLIFSGIM